MVLARSLKVESLSRLFLYFLIIILTDLSCNILKYSCKNRIRLFLNVLVVIWTHASYKILKFCKSLTRLSLRVLVIILTNGSC